MPTATALLASGVAGAVAGKLSGSKPLTEFPRAHLLFLLLATIIGVSVSVYLETSGFTSQAIKPQTVALETAMWIFLAYVFGLLTGKVVEHLEGWDMFN